MRRCLVLILLGLGLWLELAEAQLLRPEDVPKPTPTAPAVASPTNKLELRDGDRVVLLGDTLIERENSYGYLEGRLTIQYPDRNVTFRNLGWSADTPVGESRAGFDTPDKGFDQLKEQLTLVKPTVAVLGYGMASSFAGEAGLPKFVADYNKLLDTIQTVAGGSNNVRFLLLSPIRHERLPPPLPDPADHNRVLARYTQAIRDIAAQRQMPFVSLFDLVDTVERAGITNRLTDNGIHLSAYGYRLLSDLLARGLGWEANIWRVGVMKDGAIRQGSYGIKVSDLKKTNDIITFTGRPDQLVSPLITQSNKPLATLSNPGVLQFQGLPQTNFTLAIDGQPMKTLLNFQWRWGVSVDSGPDLDQAEELRQTIVKKNELFFHRYRPENNTYLFLFRKQEQGQNAKEIPQFDPLIEVQEAKIAQLRKPVPRTFQLSPGTNAPAPERAAQAEAAPAPHTPLPHPAFEPDRDLEITLYAENPLLAKPIQMNFDARGRLWVASSEVYPQIKPGQQANDKILVLEDVDGDGQAEKSTVFADGLLIPTGVEPGDDGCYVGQSTELLHFKDSDGDGKADQKRVVLSGFGTEDTHHILHTLRWGDDGQLYMNQSIYIHTHTETPHGVVRLNSGGILSLRPGTMELGILQKGLVNSWGHAIDAFGQSFATDGASSADAGLGGINWVIPQAMFFTYERARRTLGSISPGSYPKFCSLEIIRSPHFPDDWQNNFVTCDFRAHRVVRFAIDEKDSGYVTREMPDLVRSKDVTFRPIDVKLGPDGALYIADWSNPIIQHGEVDFRDARRDHEHGRIWRVTYKGRKLAPKPNLIEANNTALLNNLLAADQFTRTQSKRLLTERATNIVTDLAAWTRQQSSEKNLLEALWMYQAIDLVQPDLLDRLLNASDGHIRAAAVRVLAAWQQRQPGQEGGTSSPALITTCAAGWPSAPLPLAHRKEIPSARALDILAARVADEHPRVRVEALRALARLRGTRAAELALSVLDKPMDRFLDYTLWLTINDLAEPWIAAIQSGEWKPDGRDKQLEYGLKAIPPVKASEVMGRLLGDKPLPKDGSGPWIDLIGQAGTAKELRKLFDQVMQNGFDEDATVRAVAALNHAARVRNAKPTGDTVAMGTLFAHHSERVRLEALRLAGAWKDLGRYFIRLGQFAGGNGIPPALREAAFAALRDIGGQGAIDTLTPLAAKGNEPGIRRQAVLALAAIKLDPAVPAAVEVLNQSGSDAEALALWRALLSIKGAAPALAKALPKSGIPQPVAKAGLRAAREGGRNEPDLVLALTRGSGIDEGEVSLTETELKQLIADVQAKGDPARGEAVYRRKELSCVACHAIGGAGGKVGPDMTSLGASAPVDYLIESVWFPNKKIKEGYHALMVETKDSQEYSGVLVRESADQLILRDATGKEVPIAKSNISDRRVGTLSLMPAGLIDNLTSQERIDLFRFLSELGKAGPFDATKGTVARLWRVRPGIHTLEQFGEEKFVTSDLSSKDWLPVYANVDGRLPAAAIREAATPGKYLGLVGLYAATQLQAATDGPIKLQLASTPEALWIDGKAQTPSAELSANLSSGPHSIVLRLDPKKLPDALRLEASAGTFITN
jgi:putative heme-binding domain-containing protein